MKTLKYIGLGFASAIFMYSGTLMTPYLPILGLIVSLLGIAVFFVSMLAICVYSLSAQTARNREIMQGRQVGAFTAVVYVLSMIIPLLSFVHLVFSLAVKKEQLAKSKEIPVLDKFDNMVLNLIKPATKAE